MLFDVILYIAQHDRIGGGCLSSEVPEIESVPGVV